jgi:hypothetical protein
MLSFIAFMGFLMSFTAHILLLFKVDIPSQKVSLVLTAGIVILFLVRLVSTANLRQTNNWFWDPCIKGLCPILLKMCTITIVVYGIAMTISNLIGVFSMISPSFTKEDYLIASRKIFIGVFSLWSSCYFVEFTLNWCFEKLRTKTVF